MGQNAFKDLKTLGNDSPNHDIDIDINTEESDDMNKDDGSDENSNEGEEAGDDWEEVGDYDEDADETDKRDVALELVTFPAAIPGRHGPAFGVY